MHSFLMNSWFVGSLVGGSFNQKTVFIIGGVLMEVITPVDFYERLSSERLYARK